MTQRCSLTHILIFLFAFFSIAQHSGRAQMYQFTAFDVSNAVTTFGLGINNNGLVVGGVGLGPQSGFVWDGNTYTSVDVPGSNFTTLTGLSATGVSVGEYLDANFVTHGFERDSSGMITTLPDFSAIASVTGPAAINATGEIVGVYNEDPNDVTEADHGFLLNNGVYTTYDVPGARGTQLNGINDLGQIVVSTDGATLSYLLDNGVLTSIAFPGADATSAFGINNKTQIVGNYTLGGDTHGFLWDAGVFTSLDFPGSSDTRIFGINDQGVMVGTSDFFSHGFLITPVQVTPEPGSTSLLICILVFGTLVKFRTYTKKQGSRGTH